MNCKNASMHLLDIGHHILNFRLTSMWHSLHNNYVNRNILFEFKLVFHLLSRLGLYWQCYFTFCVLMLQLVFSSSAAVYGSPKNSPCTEDFPLIPHNPYGRTKVWFFNPCINLCIKSFNLLQLYIFLAAYGWGDMPWYLPFRSWMEYHFA
jgi:hypothetical protein